MKYFHITTFGCQMNVADSELFSKYLKQYGYLQTENIDEADMIIVNTCTVRQHAEDRALSYIGSLKKLKVISSVEKQKTKPKIVVTGCVAEMLREDLKKRFPFVDSVIGAKNIEFFPEILSSLIPMTSGQDAVSDMSTCQPIDLSAVSTFVPIARGCNNFCSYCIVPYVRGKEKSCPMKDIINEIESLVDKGTKEITLLGQNVNSYISDKIDFSDLLKEVNKIDGLERIRFLTNHPKDMSDKMVMTIAELDKVCEHIHLPLQSGSNRILELMNRKYTREQYLNLVDRIQKKIPNVSITTDLMVGFSTETEKDFTDTLDMVERVGFDFSYVFKYSSRKKTEACKLEDDVSSQTKSDRHRQLLDLCNKKATKKNNSFINRKVEVLVEKRYNNNVFIGKTRNNRTVSFTSKEDSTGSSLASREAPTANDSLLGKLVWVKIVNSKVHSLIGQM